MIEIFGIKSILEFALSIRSIFSENALKIRKKKFATDGNPCAKQVSHWGCMENNYLNQLWRSLKWRKNSLTSNFLRRFPSLDHVEHSCHFFSINYKYAFSFSRSRMISGIGTGPGISWFFLFLSPSRKSPLIM